MKWLKSFTAIFLLVAGIIFVTNFSLQMNKEEEPVAVIPIAEPELAPPPEKEATTLPEPNEGGMLRMAVRKPKTLNPLLNTDRDVDQVLRLIFEPLFILDESQKPQPNLVERYDIADGAESVTLVLLRGLKWHDGTPVTARDIAFSIKFLQAAENSLYKEMVQNIQDCTWTDDSTLKIIFTKPEALAEYSLLFPIIPEGYYKKETDPKSEKNQSPVGCGAYQFVEYNSFEEIDLAANKDYFKSAPYITNVKLIPSVDTETDVLMYYELLTDAVNTTYSDWIKYSAIRATRTKTYTSSLYDFCAFNMDKPQMQNLQFRKAIAHLIPYEKIIDEIYLSFAIIARSMVTPDHWLFEGSVFQYRYDRSLAASFLTLSEMEGQEVRILVNNENKDRLKMADMICESLLDAGLLASVEAVSYQMVAQRLEEGDFDILVGCLDLYDKPAFSADISRYAEPAYLEMLNAYRTAKTKDEAVLYAKKLQNYLSMQIPYIGITYRKAVIMVDEKIECEIEGTAEHAFVNIDSWYFR